MFNHGTFALKLTAGAASLMFAGMVQAQSSVTLYGVVDGGLLYTSKTLNSITWQNAARQFSLIDSGASPSQFGIGGTEDLGDGLKAQFKLESGFSVATGAYNDSNGNQFGRQAWIALDGRFGNVKAGLQFSPFFLALYESDPRQFSLFGSAVVNYVDNVIGTGIFNPNAVSYTTPNIAGFEGAVLYALGGEAGNFQAGRQYPASLKYDNGSLMINAAIYDGNSGGTGQTSVSTTMVLVYEIVFLSCTSNGYAVVSPSRSCEVLAQGCRLRPLQWDGPTSLQRAPLSATAYWNRSDKRIRNVGRM